MLAKPKVLPDLVQVHVAFALQLIDTLALNTPVSDSNTGAPADVPPSGVNVTALLPRKSFIEIAPDGTPANERTALSFSEMVAVAERPSSVLTCDMDIVPVGKTIVMQSRMQ